jgi:hypothetical protein
MKKLFLPLLFLLVGSSHMLSAKVTTVGSMKEIETAVQKVLKSEKPENILIVFDVTMTLIEPDVAATWVPNIEQHSVFFKHLVESLSCEQRDIMVTLAMKSMPQRLVEGQVAKTLANFSAKRIPMMGLTASLTGAVGDVKPMEDWLYETLHQFDIDFSPNFVKDKRIVFSDFRRYRNNFPIYEHGILLSNKENKVDVFISFLAYVNAHPRYIIFIDHDEGHLKHAETVMHELDPSIAFLGLCYTAGSKFAPDSIDEESFMAFWSTLANRAEQLCPMEPLLPIPVK